MAYKLFRMTKKDDIVRSYAKMELIVITITVICHPYEVTSDFRRRYDQTTKEQHSPNYH